MLLTLLIAQATPLFVDVTEKALPGVTMTSGSGSADYIIEVNGGGLVLGDFDGEGAVDLVVVDGSTLERAVAGEDGEAPRLYLGDGEGHFAPAESKAWQMAGGRWGMGGAAADIDGDGHLDLFITEWGPNRLFRNVDGEGFSELPSPVGLADDLWSTSAAFLDADLDGQLDLCVVNYLVFDPSKIASRTSGDCRWKGQAVMCGPEGLQPVHDQLFRGAGDGTFREVTVEAGFRPERAGFGLGVTTLDCDLDGDTDLYVSNDSTANHLWVNDGEGSFAEEGLWLGVALDGSGREQAGMGIAVGDVDSDGRPDLFVTNFSGEPNTLYASSGRATWRDRSFPTGLGGSSVGMLSWGTVLADFDLDGDGDFAVMNGHVYPQADAPGTDTRYVQRDELYRNVAQPGEALKFEAEPLGEAAAASSRSCAAADLDGDGDLDLVTASCGGPVRVLLNRGGTGRGLEVRLEGRRSNRDGLGARVEVDWKGGSAMREIRTAGGFQASVPAVAHFGIPAGAGPLRVTVHWPSGETQVVPSADAGASLLLTEPEP